MEWFGTIWLYSGKSNFCTITRKRLGCYIESPYRGRWRSWVINRQVTACRQSDLTANTFISSGFFRQCPSCLYFRRCQKYTSPPMVSSYLNALGFQRIAAEASVDRLKTASPILHSSIQQRHFIDKSGRRHRCGSWPL